MMKANELQPDTYYSRTRKSPGMPNIYYVLLDPKKAKALRKRLESKHPLALITPEQTALKGLRKGYVMVESFSRSTVKVTDSKGKVTIQKVETRKVFGFDPNDTVRLRAVKSKPGYVIHKAAA